MIAHRTKRRIYWRLAFYWSIICLRRRTVAIAALLTIGVALIWTFATTPMFSARSVIHVEGLDEQMRVTNALSRPLFEVLQFNAEPVAQHEPPPPASVSDAVDDRTLDSQPEPVASGGR
jgi:hypothetical protein